MSQMFCLSFIITSYSFFFLFQFILDDPNGFNIKDIGENGVVNYIYRAWSSDSKKSVVIKYGEERMKVSIILFLILKAILCMMLHCTILGF